MNSFTLTSNESEILELMWCEGRPLSRSEIIDLSPDRSWKANSIHIILNKLLEKEAIKVDGFVKTGKNYGRTFSPSVTRDEYAIMQFKQSYQNSKSPSAVMNLFSALIRDNEVDDEVIDSLEAIINERKGRKK